VSRLLTVVGARPQFVKATALSNAITKYDAQTGGRFLEETLVHTGQHYDYEMSGAFFDQLDLTAPAYYLGVGSGSHAAQTGEMLRRLEATFVKEQPDLVLVFGDTNSTLAGALAGAKLNIPVAHVEAGMRCYRRDMPEEINRKLTDHLASLLYCSSQHAVDNLAREGISQGVSLVGDIMYDVLLQRMPRPQQQSELLQELGVESGAYLLATLHRAENTDSPSRLESIMRAFDDLASDLPVIVPLHPRTKAALGGRQLSSRVVLIPPVSYDAMVVLESEARVVLTDSGGVQKEAYWLGVPCVTLRDETEWPETVAAGWNFLAGADTEKIVEAAQTSPPLKRPPIYGDGRAAERIARGIAEWEQSRTGQIATQLEVVR
jgi:UDP-GlcNAc3NAcA epimerase